MDEGGGDKILPLKGAMSLSRSKIACQSISPSLAFPSKNRTGYDLLGVILLPCLQPHTPHQPFGQQSLEFGLRGG